MTQPAQLWNEDLVDRAHRLWLRALRGDADARGPAHEVRLRFWKRNHPPGSLGRSAAPAPRVRWNEEVDKESSVVKAGLESQEFQSGTKA